MTAYGGAKPGAAGGLTFRGAGVSPRYLLTYLRTPADPRFTVWHAHRRRRAVLTPPCTVMYTGVGGVPAKDPDPGGGVPGPSESMYSSVSYISSPSLWKLWVFSSYRMPPSCAFVFLGFSRLSRSPNGETPAGWRAWRVLRVSRTYFPRGRGLPPGLTYLHPRSKPPSTREKLFSAFIYKITMRVAEQMGHFWGT